MMNAVSVAAMTPGLEGMILFSDSFYGIKHRVLIYPIYKPRVHTALPRGSYRYQPSESRRWQRICLIPQGVQAVR